MDSPSTDLLLKIIDRIVHDSTDPTDRDASLRHLRKVCGNAMPGDLIRKAIEGRSSSIERKRQMAELRQQIEDANRERQALKRSNTELLATIDRLSDLLKGFEQSQNGAPSSADPGNEVKEFYTYEEVISIIRRRFKKQHGALKLWSLHNQRLREENPDILAFSDTTIQTWRKANAFPRWAVEQLKQTPPGELPQHPWSEDELDFLCNTYIKNPSQGDDALTAICCKRFGRQVTSNAVKSKLGLLRRLNRIKGRRVSRQDQSD